ncbi:MAG: DUF2723 domain-containing protein [Bacteroidota bacterium]|nr:DUF2723 domain-containing protein [Bacteroidota bacterium]MDP4234571.1 DUF2723 domain-containing protein [Bacteroidota bacterium]MDP4243700.1 DUF2723 domain-containing protein [Bacteroidota bacterium]MDP4288352.1 DUF2723 domain-containing protein [Bacteroidota bacterium]
MQIKRIHYVLAALSFLVPLITYVTTMQPSIPFWDCGEFISAASQLGVTHPPGDPTWTLLGRVGGMLPFFSDLAARYNFLSALCGAISVMLLYLIAVRVIKIWRGTPQTLSDAITHMGGAFVAALAFTWSDSLWFNSSEFIVFSPGLLFIMLILWIAMLWHERAEEKGNERYLMLIFYLLGLSIGAHQMSMLAFFPVWVIVFYKHWKKVTWGHWFAMFVAGVLSFLYIYKVVLTGLVGWAGSGLGIISALIVIGLIGGTIYTMKEKKAFANLLLWGGLLVLLGYTTYTLLMIRGVQDPPMNQHRPTTFAALHEYVAREQYGEAREFPRRDDRPEVKGDPLHNPTWDPNKSSSGAAYTSDIDFWWRYQTVHMYLRYLGWSYIGRANDSQDATTDWTKTFGIPIILGMFGLFWHFKRDPKRALAFLAAFLVMGLLTDWYQNQQDAQPRERDYFYVGSFAVYAMWIGIGATGLMELLRARLAKKQNLPMQDAGPKDREVMEKPDEKVPVLRGEGPLGLLAGTFALALVLVPINQCIGLVGMGVFGQSFHQASKWGEYSRQHNNVPLEYAYNILQSCDQDGILFTAGDNDTFPLWCIQDLYGVRRDVRIVNLSLGNMGWYVKKLKDDGPWGSKKVNLPSFTEEQLNNPDETAAGIHYTVGPPSTVTVNVSAPAMQRFTGVAQPGSFSWKYVSQHKQEGSDQYVYQVADQLVRDIVASNFNDRPIYFAVAVPPSYWVGLDEHILFEGLTARVVPTIHKASRQLIDGDINEGPYEETAYRTVPMVYTTPYRGMLLNSYRDPRSNRSSLDDKYGTTTYFELYARMANYFIQRNRMADAHRALDTLSARMPPALVDWDYTLLQFIGQLYQATGDPKSALHYTQLAAAKLSSLPQEEAADVGTQLQNDFRRGDLYYSAQQYDSARAIFSALRPQVEGGNKLFIDFRLEQIDVKLLENKGDKRGALAKMSSMLTKYQGLSQMGVGNELQSLQQERDRLAAELGMTDSVKDSPASPVVPNPDINRAPNDTGGTKPKPSKK